MTLLDKPARLDRAEGDVHAAGNPHIQTDPRNIARLRARWPRDWRELDPGNAEAYRAQHKAFDERWRAAIARWEREAAPLKGTPVLVQHKAFTYLIAWLGMKEVAALEPKPGVEPTVAHLSEVLAIAAAATGQDGPARRVPERARIAMDRRAREDSARSCCRSRSAAIPRRRICSALFDDTIARLLKPLA